MRILIVGCGYLGRRAAALWRSRGHAISALTRSEENARALHPLGVEPIVGDVLQPASLRSLPSVDVVLYAVGYDKHAGPAKREVYVAGVENVLRQIGTDIGRFIYVSSTSVYGQDAGELVDEKSECVPATQDGQICLAAEEVVRRHLRGHNPLADAIVLRFSGIYGPGRLLRRIEAVRSGDPVRANPDGFLNLIHVEDGARIICDLSEPGRREATYLVTDDRPLRRQEYYTRLAELVGATPPTFQMDPDESGRLNKRCSNALIHAELGDVFRFPTFDVGLPNAVTSGSAAPPG